MGRTGFDTSRERPPVPLDATGQDPAVPQRDVTRPPCSRAPSGSLPPERPHDFTGGSLRLAKSAGKSGLGDAIESAGLIDSDIPADSGKLPSIGT